MFGALTRREEVVATLRQFIAERNAVAVRILVAYMNLVEADEERDLPDDRDVLEAASETGLRPSDVRRIVMDFLSRLGRPAYLHPKLRGCRDE